MVLKLQKSREYNMSADVMWNVVSDYSSVHKVHPAVKTVDQLSPEGRGEGAKRQCNFYDGGKAVEVTKDWDEVGRSYRVEIVKGSLPLKKADVHLWVQSLPGNRSKVLGEFEFTAKYGFIGRLMESFLLKPQLGPLLDKLFAGFGYYVNTGKEVTDKMSLATLNAGADQK